MAQMPDIVMTALWRASLEERRFLQPRRGEVAYEQAGDPLKKGLARYPVPVMVLARLAVATGQQGQGLGAGLPKDALLRPLQAADIAGVRAFIVHTKDENEALNI